MNTCTYILEPLCRIKTDNEWSMLYKRYLLPLNGLPIELKQRENAKRKAKSLGMRITEFKLSGMDF